MSEHALVFGLVAALCGGLAACGASSDSDADSEKSAASGEQMASDDEAASEGSNSGSSNDDSEESGDSMDSDDDGGDVAGANDDSFLTDGDSDGDSDSDGAGSNPSGDGDQGMGGEDEDVSGEVDGQGNGRGDGNGRGNGDMPGEGDPNDGDMPGMDDMPDDGGMTMPEDLLPVDERDDCTASCPVPRLCSPCGDGCADAFVPCTESGECGQVEWICEDEPVDEGPRPIDSCTANCPVPAICQLCDDGSCASPNVTCNDDGSCGAIDWQCSDEPVDIEPGMIGCKDVGQCPQILAVCNDCPNGGLACPVMQCLEGECVVTGNECTDETEAYDPCADKSDGDACSFCPPNSFDCIETDEIKACQDGECKSAVSVIESQ